MNMTENKNVANNGLSIVLYTTDDGNTQLKVKLGKISVWLNREQIAQLYGRDYKTIAILAVKTYNHRWKKRLPCCCILW